MSRPFQVDLSGVIDLLSRHIYSSPRVYLRELIQNGIDAISAAHDTTPITNPQITITPARHGEPFLFHDNGIGLTATEAAELLATVGRSSKRDPELGFRRDNYLGQFGIGLLSCFMVTDNIRIISRSRRDATAGGADVTAGEQAPTPPAIEWVGRLDGTFTITELDDATTQATPYGTTVTLHPRHHDEDLLSEHVVKELATTFAEFLPIDVTIHGTQRDLSIARSAPFITSDPHDPYVIHYGRELIGNEPLAVIPLDIPATATRGVAYVLPYAPPPGAAASTRVYLSHMLLAERMPDVLPPWASFVHAVITTDYLTPTASREQLIANDALNDTRDAIGAAITAWVQEQATHHRDTLADLVAVHHVALRHMATHYDDLGRAIIPLLPVETSAGTMSIAEYLETTHTVRYAATVDEYRQVSTIVAPDRPVINAGYTFIEDLLMRLPTLNPDVTVHKVAITEELHNLSPVPYDDAPKARSFEERATQALDLTHVTVTARSYTPDNLPALYVADPSVLQWMERDASKDVAQGPWADILAQTDSIYEGLGAKATAHLCLNWNNRAVRSLASVTDPIIMTRSIRLMYAQAKLSGHHPLTTADRTMLTQSLDDLITLSLGVPDTDFPEI